MPIDFPNSPTTNQEFTATGRTWIYDGAKWVAKLAYGAHGATHAASGTDAVLLEQSQVNTLPATLLGKVETATYNAAGKNVVINGGFDVWQRGTSYSLSNAGYYTIDRFYTGTAGGGTFAITQQAFSAGQTDVPNAGPYFAQIAVGSVAGGELTNRIEDVRTLAGQVATFSFYARTTSGTAGINAEYVHYFGTAGSTAYSTNAVAFTLTTTWQRFSFTSTIPNVVGKTIGAGSYLGARITGMQIGTFQIANIQVEAGSVATPFSRAGGTLAGEIQACKRYYQRFSTIWQAFGVAATTGLVFLTYPLSTMRAAPTGIDYSNITVGDINNSSLTTSSIAINQANPEFAFVVFNVSGAVQYRPYAAFVTGGSGYIGFNAEL